MVTPYPKATNWNQSPGKPEAPFGHKIICETRKENKNNRSGSATRKQRPPYQEIHGDSWEKPLNTNVYIASYLTIRGKQFYDVIIAGGICASFCRISLWRSRITGRQWYSCPQEDNFTMEMILAGGIRNILHFPYRHSQIIPAGRPRQCVWVYHKRP